MVNPISARKDFNNALKEWGQIVRFRYFTMSGADTGYDDNVSLTKSGNDYFCSGVIQPIDKGLSNSNEAVLVQQGLLKNDDLRLYVGGVVNTSGTWRLGLGGSPAPGTHEYGLAINNGVIDWDSQGTTVYKKIYLRNLVNGSIVGE